MVSQGSEQSVMVNGYDPGAAAALTPAARALITRRERVLGSAYRLFYREPVHVVRGQGAHLFDADGHDYLDAYNNVPAVGHSNPRVQAAVAAQLATLNTHTRYLTDDVIDYAERLTAKFAPPLSQVIFTCTGSEAVDLAVRMARRVTGGEGIIVTRNAYHGTTSTVAEITPSLGPNNPIPARTALIDAPDSVRGSGGAAAIAAFTEQVRGAIAGFAAQGIPFAGMIVDSVLSSDGMRLEPAGFLAAAAQVVREAGGLYIADEVQPGFGRTGAWWGFERHGLVPDLVVVGKPMGNGVPIAAVVGSEHVFDAFGSEVRYFNTFGGNPVSIAAATAVLDEIEQRDLIAHSAAAGQRLSDGIRQIAADAKRVGAATHIAQVRGAGLFIAVEYVSPTDGVTPDPQAALAVVQGLRDRRILVSASGTYENVLKVRPPLVFDTEGTGTHPDTARFLEGFAAVTRDAGQ
ncbi:4-aminobutyrate aminotransferase-like enzyme [Leucobacter exalbidus]|uniref:4-aminobutyrate aminotransferase-like enzyme n=1 Tax=Leucobacter exalbidus TaxID=662960 RepID=A0A940T4V4_9MICO|nr:aminotransferase class III-fold pyridoxal phosphate-dependent enzyme [Leucobacter exalbidus]MBP1327348.1 4-aminobutyrate aminotransferase-like enzyme [Leucobacter exalbidus]